MATQPLYFQAPIFSLSPTCYSIICVVPRRVSLVVMTQTSSCLLTWAHQALFNTYTCFECTVKSGSPPVVSSPLPLSLCLSFLHFSLASPLLLHPSLSPSLPSKPMLCRGEIDTAFSAQGVWVRTGERRQTDKDYSQRRRQWRTITD